MRDSLLTLMSDAAQIPDGISPPSASGNGLMCSCTSTFFGNLLCAHSLLPSVKLDLEERILEAELRMIDWWLVFLFMESRCSMHLSDVRVPADPFSVL